MIRIQRVTKEIVEDVRQFLYRNELVNLIAIGYFEKGREAIGELYVDMEDDMLKSILHIKYDGNSHFATFHTEDELGFKVIADQLKEINYPDLLLAGVDSDVESIMKYLNLHKEIETNSFYVFEGEINKVTIPAEIKYKVSNNSDLEMVKEFKYDFFEATTEAEKENLAKNINLSNTRLISWGDEPVGYGSFFGGSDKYIDICNIYISRKHRGMGYSNYLLKFMIQEAISKEKIPVLQANDDNIAANKAYKNAGFKRAFGYAFEFIKKKPS